MKQNNEDEWKKKINSIINITYYINLNYAYLILSLNLFIMLKHSRNSEYKVKVTK